MESSDAPYFVDLVNDELQNRFQNHDFHTNSCRVYTTLDLSCSTTPWKRFAWAFGNRRAMEAAEQEIRHQRIPCCAGGAGGSLAETGKVALVGGRSYGNSQLNHASAKRQPGSSFKPFVYTAAMMSALDPAEPHSPDAGVDRDG